MINKFGVGQREPHTEWWGVILGEHLILGPVRVKEEQVVEVTDAVGQGADGEVFGRVWQQVPDQPLTQQQTTMIAFNTTIQFALIT